MIRAGPPLPHKDVPDDAQRVGGSEAHRRPERLKEDLRERKILEIGREDGGGEPNQDPLGVSIGIPGTSCSLYRFGSEPL
jgi:hypothetical protein